MNLTTHSSHPLSLFTDSLLCDIHSCIPFSSVSGIHEPTFSSFSRRFDYTRPLFTTSNTFNKCTFSASNFLKSSEEYAFKKFQRTISSIPARVLDAPSLLDDFYLHLLDWGQKNLLAVALSSSVYIWDDTTLSVQELTNIASSIESSSDYISSVKWMNHPSCSSCLAVGLSNGTIEIWDAEAKKKIRTLHQQQEELNLNSSNDIQGKNRRIASLAWNNHILTSGNRLGSIYHSDIRVPSNHIAKIEKAHLFEVCGLSWSPDGMQLASGGNDNIVNIWDGLRTTSSTSFQEHSAAIKAIAWCPWQSKLIATGGGTSDKKIMIWNSMSGECLKSVDCGSQVTSLHWSSSKFHELISSHGYSENQIIIWKYPTMKKITELKSHSGRILTTCISSDGSTLISIGADECMNFWKIYPPNSKKNNETVHPVSHIKKNSDNFVSNCTKKSHFRTLPASPNANVEIIDLSFSEKYFVSSLSPILSPKKKSLFLVKSPYSPTESIQRSKSQFISHLKHTNGPLFLSEFNV